MEEVVTTNALATFEGKKVRKTWYNGRWYFSVVDVVSVLIDKDYQTSRKYWNKLSERLKKEGANESVTKCHQLKMMSSDGKNYKT